ncbi:NAD-dependent protein deacylase [Gemmata obscuriglobus]|uniref:NAD-dependent protein deacylase n=1 Tax=Gemmata obscuriglobus TaxID=114 RepID=A0A2Z3H205_9BACT|nr:NAD-dependent deacylase [Gemmata obscuriglobus]AWM37747.1 NAD-dependent deacylase [Gemmata obscuriglobus]QEG29441.1 NAD-dependent protein deacylase [Gemmata obscuriglobus]VTS08556.1 nad-dependent protein deacylase : NAD-dependent protein deacylase OS=Syntrophobacter fumaroxidans (strain DSM 10017 / MPOB) GN=cobB PE=3 SV=1: SIR2 [Gemmata obscuriglobus UQM 2246]
MTDDELNDALDRAARWLRAAKSVCVLTGAGISAESGVPTFRASDGLWEGHRIEDVASPDGWDRNPALVWQFYNARRANVATVKPNPGHFALVALEDRFGDNFKLVTQNVDGLHLQAGSRRVLEIHGSLRQTRCTVCEAVTNRGLEPLGDAPECPQCHGRLRPHIVWFGEGLPDDIWMEAMVSASECDTLLVVGTSAVVHPAASLVPIARRKGATVIEVNITRTEASAYADIGLYGPSGEVLPKLLQRLG